MLTEAATIALAPMLPWSVLAPLFAVAAAAVAYAFIRRARGAAWRALAVLALIVILLDPSLVEEEREPINDVAVVVVDRSPSQDLGDREGRADRALADLRARLDRESGLEVRIVEAGGASGAIDETELFAALDRATADVPRRRLAGAFLVTDGQVHDVPARLDGLAEGGPVHTLLTGERDEADRRLVVANAPAFGLVGQRVTVTVRVDDLPEGPGEGPRTARLTVTRDGTATDTYEVPVGVDQDLDVPIEHGGSTVLEFEVEAGPRELTLANNAAAVVVNGVRDRLRVLLVSGEPHQGERTWRNILKSDPAVDLVHFTILRPPEKQDGTPIDELSLIAFPIRELFELRLDEFDLVIFDRYRRRGVLPNIYFANIARYVEEGGALLEASGPSFADMVSVYRTPLGSVLPGEPTGNVVERPFRPGLTDLGRRHPVTTALLEAAGPPDTEPTWGRWFQQIDVVPSGGYTLMGGIDDRPLLILDRVGEGRVAQLTSDQMWLWARGFEGGGPQGELLRRLAHWLMKEPELEENDLRATVDGTRIAIERRALDAAPRSVEVETPSGESVTVELADDEDRPGRWTGTLAADEPGIFRISDGELTTLAVVGTLNPLELTDMRTTAAVLSPVAEATGGAVRWLAEDGLPEIRRVRPERDTAGRTWLGLRANGDYVVTGVREVPLLPAALALLLGLGLLMAAWRREGR
ncbi:MAG: hypothetical protein GVY28_06740 [Alphaproteobacteria bacterium]|jgi:hypothetical protein|nr:hypothetical protein [Alphaproteobacteria bacterium]